MLNKIINKIINKMENSNILNDKVINFNLSDCESNSDSDSDNYQCIELVKQNIKIFDNLDLKYFPEPYNSLGQFILSSISGTIITYIVKKRSKQNISENEYIKYLDMYYTYCNSVTTVDNYLNDILKKFNYDESDSEQINLFLLNASVYAKEIITLFFNDHSNIYNNFVLISDDDFSIDNLNIEIVKIIIPYIKLCELIKII